MSGSTTSISRGDRASGNSGITMPQVNPHWAKPPLFDRKGWQRVWLAQIVDLEQLTQRVNNC